MLGKGPCLAAAAVALALLATDLHSWFPTDHRWVDSGIPVPMTLSVGSGWNAVARDGLTIWNHAGSNFRFRSTTSARERPSCRATDVDRRNVVVWGADLCGSAWGEGTLAVANTWSYISTGEAVDSDVIFNSNFSWSSYRGNLRRDTIDFGRVAIHEFGHVLGLDHPDDHGQSVSAIMNARVSDIDTIQVDDIAGVRGIYGHDAGGNQPPRAGGSIPAQTLTVGGGSTSVNVAPYFTDPDGDRLTYTTRSRRTGVVRASVSGSTVTLTPVAAGAATIAVTARDPGGESATQSFAVTVEGRNEPPPSGCALDDLGALGGTVMRVGNLGDDCVSPNFSGGLARFYSFTLATAAAVEIDLVSSEFDAWLALREGADVEGRALVQDDDGGQGTNSRIATDLAAGRYTIEATSFTPGDTGAFTLTVTAAGAGGGRCALDDLGAVSGTVMRVGDLDGDCESPSYPGRLARYYSFTLGQAGPVEVDLFSTAFDTFLALREGTDAAGPLVVSDDDGGEGTNSRIATELSAGTYTIEATSFGTGVTGAFTLAVTAAGGGGGGCALDDLGALNGTATRVGNLGADCESPSYAGRLARYYSFTLGQAGPVEIDLVSSVFDAFLTLREGTDVAGRLVATDDDGGQGTNSRISTELSAGTYTIEATSYATGVAGAFTLTVTAAGGGGGGCALDDLGALSGTATRVGNLGDDCESPSYSGRLARYYSFTLGQAGPVEIDLVSSAFDTFLALREGTDVAGGLVATDDDGGQGTNSRIDTTLSAGTYTIEATSYATGVTGAFTLTVTGVGGGGGGGCALDDLGALNGTATRAGTLGGDCESPSYPGRLARYYSFTLGQSGPVEIDLVSSAFDTWLSLREGAGVAGPLVVSDDDGGQGTNSRIATALSAGTYTIEATSRIATYATGVTGTFTLTVTVTQPTGELRITSNGGGDRATITLPENRTQVTTVTASGGTPPYEFQWSSNPEAPDGLRFVMNTTTGALAFVTAPDYENPTDSDGDNNYGVNVRVTDASVPTQRDSQVITVRITDVAERDSDDDRAVLEALYHATGGPNWTNSTNWLTDAPLDEWAGVETNHNGRVMTLELYGNQLTGSIPSSLGSLTNLEYLGLSGNQLTGSIPPSLGSLTNLRLLGLGDNQLTGSIPPSLDSLTNLAYLELYRQPVDGVDSALPGQPHQSGASCGSTDNQLTGSIPPSLGSLINLESLSLSRNQLTGSIPSSLGSLTNLRRLWLYNNQLTGALPRTLLQLTLETLDIADTQVCVPPDAAFQQWLTTISEFTSSGLTCDADASDACRVGQELSPGGYCTVDIPNISVGTNRFEVRSDGRGCYGSICAGRSINLNGFEASRVSGTSRWRIDAVPGGGPRIGRSRSRGSGERGVLHRPPVGARGDADQGRSLHGAADAHRRVAGRGGAGAVPMDGPGPRAQGDPDQGRVLAGAAGGARRGVRGGGRVGAGWTDPEPTPGVTPIKAVYVMELRAAVVALE